MGMKYAEEPFNKGMLFYLRCPFILESPPPQGYDVISALFDNKYKLIRLSPIDDCTHIPLLSYSLDGVTALRAKLWQ